MSDGWLKLRCELQGVVTETVGGDFLVVVDVELDAVRVVNVPRATSRGLFMRHEIDDNLHKTDVLTKRLKMIKDAAKSD